MQIQTNLPSVENNELLPPAYTRIYLPGLKSSQQILPVFLIQDD